MAKIRQGGYVFVTFVGDHPPRHVHVYRDRKLIVKWDLERHTPIQGRASGRLRRILAALQEAGRL